MMKFALDELIYQQAHEGVGLLRSIRGISAS
jgi:hypothetical protein